MFNNRECQRIDGYVSFSVRKAGEGFEVTHVDGCGLVKDSPQPNISIEFGEFHSDSHINISSIGMAFIVRDTYRIGNIIEIDLYLSDSISRQLTVFAEVIRVEPDNSLFHIACRFLLPSAGQKVFFARYLMGKDQEPVPA